MCFATLFFVNQLCILLCMLKCFNLFSFLKICLGVYLNGGIYLMCIV